MSCHTLQWAFYGQSAAPITVPFWSAISKGAVLQISVLFSADYKNPFVEIHPEHPEIIYILDARRTVVVPCRVTSPDIKPKLTQVSDCFRETQSIQRLGLPTQWVKKKCMKPGKFQKKISEDTENPEAQSCSCSVLLLNCVQGCFGD